MLIEHERSILEIDSSAYVAPNATICGNVSIGGATRIMFGASIVAEGAPITIGDICIVMEMALSAAQMCMPRAPEHICHVGPNSHLVDCVVEDCVFIATGASIFHGAVIEYGAKIRINAVVHLRTRFPRFSVVPIRCIAVGDPVAVLPPDQHDAIWTIQKPMDFPHTSTECRRPPEGATNKE